MEWSTVKRIFLLFFSTCFLANNLEAQGDKGVELEIDLATDYIWRDLVYGFPVVQSTVTKSLDSSGFSLAMWTSIGAKIQTNDIEFSSTMNYDFMLAKKLIVSVGMVHYVAAINTELEGDEARNTNAVEAFIILSREELFSSPFFEFYYDITGQAYFVLNRTHQLFKNKKLPLELNLTIGLRTGSKLIKQRGLTHVTTGLEFPFHLRKSKFSLFGNHIYLPHKKRNYKGSLGIRLHFK